MAFKTKSTRRFSARKLETRAHANRSFKKVVRQWELVLNIKCQIVEAQAGIECPNGGKFVLVSNAELQGNVAFANFSFPDALRIRRMQGNLYFRPTAAFAAGPTGTNCVPQVIGLQEHTTYARFGLRKLPGPASQAGVPDALNPLQNGADPTQISDYADGRWLKMWEHVWNPIAEISASLGNNFSCCTPQAGYAVPGYTIVAGEAVVPGYTVPAAVCAPCGDTEDPAVDLACTFTARQPMWWHMPFRYGRTIVMKEADDLSLYFGWERLLETFQSGRQQQPNMEFFGGIRMLLES